MKLGQVKRSSVVTQGVTTFHTICVWKHKTTLSHGSAKLVLPEWVFTLLTKYIKLYRNGIKDDGLVFVTRTGERVAELAGELEKLAAAFGKEVIGYN